MSMPATDLNVEDYRKVVGKVRTRRKKVASDTVVNLFHERNKRKKKDLTSSERENLVLDFRLKARKLARSILRKWHARLDLQEVDSVVDLSLCEAVKRFDPTKGASFMTFLFYHLRGNLIRAVSAAASANTVPVADNRSEEQKGKGRKRAGSRGINAIEVAEALCSHEYMLPDEVLFKKELVNLSTEACEKLDALEREVIYRIYIKEQQLMDIAHSLGYSRCHISRVKKKALETLYDEMSTSMELVGEEEDGAKKVAMGRMLERRKIYRRRPRSKKALAAKRGQKDERLAAVA